MNVRHRLSSICLGWLWLRRMPEENKLMMQLLLIENPLLIGFFSSLGADKNTGDELRKKRPSKTLENIS